MHQGQPAGDNTEADDSEQALQEWLAEPRLRVTTAETPVEQHLLLAIQEGREVEIIYSGGSQPGLRRRVRPLGLFRLAQCGCTYLTAFCTVRQAERTFRVGAIGIDGVSQTGPLRHPVMRFYFAAPSAAAVSRIVAAGFSASDGIMAELPYGNPTFVSQLGILFSSELDPRTVYAVEITTAPNPRYLVRHELISPVRGVQYYVFLQDIANRGTRRAVPEGDLQAARAAGLDKWRDPLAWFGRDQEPVKGTGKLPCPGPVPPGL